MPKTIKYFFQGVKISAFPTGLPDRLEDSIDDASGKLLAFGFFSRAVINALTHIQQHCPFYQNRNSTIFPFCSTFFKCGATVVSSPRVSEIERVYTLPENINCCPIFYDRMDDFDAFINWLLATRPRWVDPDNIGLPDLPAGFRFNDPIEAADTTNKGLRYNWGRYAINNGKIYVGHRIESSERLVVEWNGVKRSWTYEDLLPVTGPYDDTDSDAGLELEQVCVHAALEANATVVNKDANEALFHKTNFINAVAELIWRRKQEEKSKLQAPRTYGQMPAGPCAATRPECVTPEEPQTLFALVAGVSEGTPASDVATLIDSWGVNFVVTAGNQWYDGATPDEDFGQYYYKFLYPYRGSEGVQTATEQKLFAAYGLHDQDPAARFSLTREFFNLPPTNRDVPAPNKGYYDIRKGDFHFFFFNGDTNADGVGEDSAQGIWMTKKVQSSNARWKIGIVNKAPYGSVNADCGTAALQWIGKLIGLDVVVSGSQFYEHLIVDSFNYISVLSGGATIGTPGTTCQYSELIDASDYGATRLTAKWSSLVFETITRGGTIIDTVTITK